MQQSMDREIAANKLADLTLQTKPLTLSDAQLQRLRALPNVEAVGAKSRFSTRIYVGARRQRALIMGIPDFDRQDVDVVTPISGSAPSANSRNQAACRRRTASASPLSSSRSSPYRRTGSSNL